MRSPTGDCVLPGLLRSALRALACKSWACRPWQARSPGQGSPGVLAPLRLTHPRTTASFLCVPKARNRKKGHPGLPCREAPMPRVHDCMDAGGRAAPGAVAEGRTGAACATHAYFPCGAPALGPRLRRSAQGPFFAPAFPASLESPGLAVRGEPVRRDDHPPDCHLCPSHPCAWCGRAVSLPRPGGRVLRLRAALGLSKGV